VFVVGVIQVGGREDFATEMLEWRIARSGVIEYSGDLLTPPDVKGKGDAAKLGAKGIKGSKGKGKTIRGTKSDSDSDDDY